MPVYDLKIEGATIVDGSGAPRFTGDIGIRDGRVVDVGDAPEDARQHLDCSGRVVCPGFIDIHTHYDPQIMWDRTLSPSSWQGVTTVVMGNCGFGIAPTRPESRERLLRTLQHVEGMNFRATTVGLQGWGFETFPEYLDRIDSRGVSINVAVMIGHTPIRFWVMGDEAQSRKEATASEMEQMRALIREAMDAGAAGFATSNSPAHSGEGGVPVPSRWTTVGELKQLVSAVAESGRGVFQCTWGPEVTPDTIEALSRATGVPICGPGLGPSADGERERKVFSTIERLRQDGLVWRPQTGVLPNTFEVGLAEPFMFAIDQPAAAMKPAIPLTDLFVPIMDMETEAERLAAYKTPSFRRRFRTETDEPGWNSVYWPRLSISYVPTRPELEGRMILNVASDMGVSPADLVLDLCLETDLQARFGAISGAAERFPVKQMEFYTSGSVVLGLGDAGAHQSQLFDGRYPARLLGTWVRERGLPLERAIQMLTKDEADLFGIHDRGVLKRGLAADLVVFDPKTVQDGPLQRRDDLPTGARRLVSEPVGIDYVIVNGTVIRDHGRDILESCGDLPGMVIRDFR